MLKIIVTVLSTEGDFYTFIQFIPERKKKKRILQNTNKLQIEFKNISISLLFSHKYIFINKMH